MNTNRDWGATTTIHDFPEWRRLRWDGDPRPDAELCEAVRGMNHAEKNKRGLRCSGQVVANRLCREHQWMHSEAAQ